MKLISYNLTVPNCTDTEVLEVVTAGLNILMDGYYNKGQGPDDFLLRDAMSLTMGDHTADLVIDDARFEWVYAAAMDVLDRVMLTQWEPLTTFLNTLTGYEDLISLQYPGLIKLMVSEESTYGNSRSPNLYIPQS